MGNKLRSRWPLLFFVLLVLLTISYYFYSQCIYPVNRAVFIEGYGILCAASVLFLTFYIIRKKRYGYRIGAVQGWLQAHVYIGIISVVLLCMHFRFKPTGTFSIFLSLLFFLVIISGIAGSLIYHYVPLSLTKYGRTIKSEEEIDSSMESCLEKADKLVDDTSEDLKEIYRNRIRPFLMSKRTKWEYLLMEERELIDKRRDMIESCKDFVTGQDVHDLSVMGSILAEKETLSFTLAKLKLMRTWLNFHMPVTMALLTATIIHILTVVYY